MKPHPFFSTGYIIVLILLMACDGNDKSPGTVGSEPEDKTHFGHLLPGAERQILVFSKTAGWRHSSIEAGRDALYTLGEKNETGVLATEDASFFTPGSLAGFDAVVLLNTTGTIFNDEQKTAFTKYVRDGGGVVGVHSASDTEYDWPWYGKMLGAWFDNHPPGIHSAEIRTENSTHPATDVLPERWTRNDEWYNFRRFEDHINVLLRLDTNSYEGSDHPGNHPIAWYHEFEGGRVFYTGLGHTTESYAEPLFLEHLWGGIRYAMGAKEE